MAKRPPNLLQRLDGRKKLMRDLNRAAGKPEPVDRTKRPPVNTIYTLTLCVDGHDFAVLEQVRSRTTASAILGDRTAEEHSKRLTDLLRRLDSACADRARSIDRGEPQMYWKATRSPGKLRKTKSPSISPQKPSRAHTRTRGKAGTPGKIRTSAKQ